MGKKREKSRKDELEKEEVMEDETLDEEEEVDDDPYKLNNVEYFKPSGKYKYKQKVLVFGNRGISQLGRHLLKDLKSMLPHHKSESKWEGKTGYEEINELCELNSCSSTLYLESRKSEMVMWVARTPYGPTLKARVMNVHTLKDSTFSGNCLARSRPLLTFDKSFKEVPHLKLVQTLLTQILGTPNNHPKSMPFHDHCLSFFFFDNRIYVRHYQISPKNEFSVNSPENQVLNEIGWFSSTYTPRPGPQFVLEPILILNGSFSGVTLWRNSKYISPLMVRRYHRSLKQSKRRKIKPKKEEFEDLSEDELSMSKVFGAPSE